jgi:hypothetical protein
MVRRERGPVAPSSKSARHNQGSVRWDGQIQKPLSRERNKIVGEIESGSRKENSLNSNEYEGSDVSPAKGLVEGRDWYQWTYYAWR